MLKSSLAITLIGLTVGLAACDNKGQEQAQQPNQPARQSTESKSPNATSQGAPSQAPRDQPTTPPSADQQQNR